MCESLDGDAFATVMAHFPKTMAAALSPVEDRQADRCDRKDGPSTPVESRRPDRPLSVSCAFCQHLVALQVRGSHWPTVRKE